MYDKLKMMINDLTESATKLSIYNIKKGIKIRNYSLPVPTKVFQICPHFVLTWTRLPVILGRIETKFRPPPHNLVGPEMINFQSSNNLNFFFTFFFAVLSIKAIMS